MHSTNVVVYQKLMSSYVSTFIMCFSRGTTIIIPNGVTCLFYVIGIETLLKHCPHENLTTPAYCLSLNHVSAPLNMLLIRAYMNGSYERYANAYKPSIILIGHTCIQAVQTQIRRHRMRRLIRVSTVCLQI